MKIFLMNQTHTDIGYTDRQEKIKQFHIDYLKQAIIISEKIVSKERPEWDGYVWNNESFWIIEMFMQNTDESWHKRLFDAIDRKHIVLTGNYLNVTDLVDRDILEKYLNKAKTFGEKINHPIKSAISMDINGWNWAYSDLFYNAGISRFYTCIHNHHGFVPMENKHNAFYWETPNNKKILVWNGDVYNQGNVAKITPDVLYENRNGEVFTSPLILDENLEYAKEWLDDYLESVRLTGYNYDFLPLMTKGMLVDNAPPNPHIIEAIKAFNSKYSNEYEIELVSIDEFFDYVESLNLNLPTYKGDWTDWWSDGYMSSPKGVMLYREAQRLYHMIKSFTEKGIKVNTDKLNELEYNLMMYSEHTWGYFTSVSEPWNKMTNLLDSRNELFASLANKYAYELLDEIKVSKGELLKQVGRPMRYKVINPFNEEKTIYAKLYINWWENFLIKDGYILKDITNDKVVSHQEVLVDQKSRKEVNVYVELKAYEERIFEIIPSKERVKHVPLDPLFTRDTTYDYISKYLDNTIIANQFRLENDFYKISWEVNKGITQFYDKELNISLLDDKSIHNAFTPIYEVAKILNKYQFQQEEIYKVRADFGRNRKIFSSQRNVGKLINVRVLENGPLVGKVELKFDMDGSIYTTLQLTIYRDKKQVDVNFILGKQLVWEPESLYLSLPFSFNNDDVLYIDKQEVFLRPGIDQLPKTCTQFYTMTNGFAKIDNNNAIIISTPDAPLLYMGSLEPHEIILSGEKEINKEITYSWLMNNYWETNFATSLANFYEYKYSLTSGKYTKEEAFDKLKSMNKDIIVIQIGYGE